MNAFAQPVENAGRLLIYLALLVLPVANAPVTGDTLEIKTHLFRMLGFAAGVLWISIEFVRRKFREPDATDLAVWVGAAALLASLFAAESRTASLPGAVDAMAALAFFLLARTVFTGSFEPESKHAVPLMWVLGASAVLPALMFLAEQYHIAGITDTLGNQNVVSHYLLVTLAAPIYAAVVCAYSPRSPKFLLSALIIAVLGWIIWKTAARGAVVGLLAAFALIAVLACVRFWLRIPSAGRAVAIAACVVIALAAPVLLYKYATSTDFNVLVRFLSWKYSISLLTDRLFLGYGPGSFVSSFEKSKLWMSDEDSELLGFLTVNYAHNDYVELAVEQGALGLSAFLFLIAVCLGPAALRWVKEKEFALSSHPHAMRLSILFVLIASLSQAFFDFVYHTPATRAAGFILLGLLASPPALPSRPGPEPTPAEPDSATNWILASFILIFLTAAAAPFVSIFGASVISHVAEPQFKSGRYDQVTHMHKWAQEMDPSKSTHAFRRGLGEEKSGAMDDARMTFKQALALQPYFPNIYFHLGVTEMQDNPGRAAAAFSASLAFTPNPTALHNLAAMALILGDSPAAAGIYSEIGRRYPDDANARRNAEVLRAPEPVVRPLAFRLALEFYQKNQHELAQPKAEEFLKEYPDDPEGVFLLGRILFHRAKYPEAARVLGKYISMAPRDPEGRYYLGNLHFVGGQYPESLEAYREAARLDPGSPKILYNLGVAYYSLRDFRSMNDCFDTVVSINPNVSTRAKIEELRSITRRVRERSPEAAPEGSAPR